MTSTTRQDYDAALPSGTWQSPGAVPIAHLVVTCNAAASGSLSVWWSSVPPASGANVQAPDASVAPGQVAVIDTGHVGGRTVSIADSQGGAFSVHLAADVELIDSSSVPPAAPAQQPSGPKIPQAPKVYTASVASAGGYGGPNHGYVGLTPPDGSAGTLDVGASGVDRYLWGWVISAHGPAPTAAGAVEWALSWLRGVLVFQDFAADEFSVGVAVDRVLPVMLRVPIDLSLVVPSTRTAGPGIQCRHMLGVTIATSVQLVTGATAQAAAMIPTGYPS